MTKLLVTGGAGFIGSNFVRHWRCLHPDELIVVLDAVTYAGNRKSIEDVPAVHFVHGDIRDRELVVSLLRDHDVDTIVHFAAETHVDRSIGNPDVFVGTNLVGTHTLLRAARECWLEGSGRPHRFHHISTDEVYGSLAPDAPAAKETTPYAPNSPYSASKAGADHLVRAYHHTYGLSTTISNCSNNYGPYQFPEKLIPLFIINALAGRQLPIYGDGKNVRDWLHVEDHCRAIELILAQGAAGETYNIGGVSELTNLSVVKTICEEIDRAVALDPRMSSLFPATPAARGELTAGLCSFVTDRPGHDRRYAIDETKIRRTLGFAPKYQFALGMRETVDWYLHNEEWWRPLLKRR